MFRPGPPTRSIARRAAGGCLLALLLSTTAFAGQVAAPAGEPLEVAKVAKVAKVADMRGEHASADVRRMADWAVSSGDTGGLPFVIVDKRDSRVFVFEADGSLRGATPALVGLTRGDQAPADIGNRPIASIQPQERITPAGRFTATMGRGPHGEDILWVDYDSALALHRVVTNVPAERRLQRLQSKQASERRITYGCINVPVAFYDSVVSPTFRSTRGIVYILPEVHPLDELFGKYQARHEVSQAAGVLPVAAH